MRYPLLIAYLILLMAFSGCQCTTAANGQKTSLPHDYNSRRIYLYSVHATDSTGNLKYTDTLGLLCTDRKWRVDSTQNLISWLYLATSKGRLTLNPDVVNNSYTGVISNVTELFLHPPRENRYVILEVCPFPYLLFPLTSGKIWTYDLEVGDHYANHAVQWKGNELFYSSYKVKGETTISLPAGNQRCMQIHATNTSRFGISHADFYYNNLNGMVRLRYKPIDRSTIDISFIKSYYDESLFTAKGLPAITKQTSWDLYGR